MGRADRYVLTGFGLTLFFTLALIAVLFVVADAFQNLDEFVLHLRRSGAWGGLGLLGRYYAAKFLVSVGSFGEIAAVAPAVVFAASMARSNEFVAVLAAGRSLPRAVLPVFAGCAAVGAAAFCLRTAAGPTLVRSENASARVIFDRAKTMGGALSVQGRSGATSCALSVEEYDPASRRARGFRACLVEPTAPFVDIRAASAEWDSSRGAWVFSPAAKKWSYPVSAGGPAVEELAEFPTCLGPDLLEAEEMGPGVLSTGALFRERSRPELAAALHERLALLLSPVALALAAVPFVLTTDRSRVFTGVAVAALVIALYEVVARSFVAAVASGHLPALVGAWLPPVAFGAAGALGLKRIGT